MNQVSNFNSYNEKKKQVLIYDDHVLMALRLTVYLLLYTMCVLCRRPITSEQKFVSVTYKYYFLIPTPQFKSKIVLLPKHS